MERGGVDGAGAGAAAADNTTMTTARELCSESNNNNLIVLGTKTRSQADFADGDGPPELGSVSVAAANKERGHQSLMETLLAQKMAQASSVFMRSDSVQSVQSVESNCSSLACEHCRCDDCILGITDHHVAIADHADLAGDLEGKMRLQSQFLSSVAEAAGAAVAAPGGLGIGGADVRGETGDNGTFRRKPSGWRKLRSMVQWTPFIQTYKHRKYQWVQLAGHSGNFKAGQRQGTVMKKLCASEEECYKRLHGDALEAFVPEYQGTLEVEDEESKSKQKFIQLQDCLSSFTLPSVMDCKIGVRTYLEEELAKAKEKQKLRKDMYEKMIAVDPDAPSAKEHEWKGVTKPRYMVWRETISSTATLGFRIEGVKKSDGSSSKDFKTTKEKEDILKAFKNFISGSTATAQQYLERLVQIRRELSTSEFFKTHELIGSSLLFVHDSQKAGVWLIDFGKTVSVPEGLSIDHNSPWEVGNHEDGYLIGIENLILLFKDLVTMLEGEDKDDSKSNNQKDSEEKPIVDASSAQN